MKLKQFLPYFTNPDISNFVIHMTGRKGRSNDCVPPDLQKLSPHERLFQIISERRIRAFPVFWSEDDVVCFSELTKAGMSVVIDDERYGPWSIAFHKDTVFRRGAGPAYYIRGDEWRHVDDFPKAVRFRCTPLWPGVYADEADEFVPNHLKTRSLFAHEREWRVRGVGDPPAFEFEWSDIAFVVVETPGWLASNFGDLQGTPEVVIDRKGKVLVEPPGLWG